MRKRYTRKIKKFLNGQNTTGKLKKAGIEPMETENKKTGSYIALAIPAFQ